MILRAQPPLVHRAKIHDKNQRLTAHMTKSLSFLTKTELFQILARFFKICFALKTYFFAF